MLSTNTYTYTYVHILLEYDSFMLYNLELLNELEIISYKYQIHESLENSNNLINTAKISKNSNAET